MRKANIFADKNIPIGKINDDIYSSFIEHLGRCVYEGIYEPDHPTADEDGFRKDVMELIKDLNLSYIRYPGGNFVSGYDWKNGIGPKEKRPVKLDLAWATTETNQFGTDEFMKWCKKAGVKPMMAVNLGSGSPMAAAELVEYCNYAGKSTLSDMRRANGGEQPYNVKTWCLGNEMDAEGQIGHLDAAQYALKSKEAAKLMRYVDKELKLVCCGSCSTDAITYPEWDRIMLEILYDDVEYLSLHEYFWARENDNDFFASAKQMDEYIKTMLGVCDYVKVKRRSKKEMMLSFDEWNIWNMPQSGEAAWKVAPHILEDCYTLKDAIVFASLLNTLINHCDRVKCACLAQMVNVIAPIFTQKGGKAIKQTTYYPFQLFSRFGRGTAYLPIIGADKLTSPKHGEFSALNACVVKNEERGELCVFCCNFSQEDLETEIELRSFGELEFIEHIAMKGDLTARNTFENENAVLPEKLNDCTKGNGVFKTVLPKQSFQMIRYKCI